jgi:hypothetical protein
MKTAYLYATAIKEWCYNIGYFSAKLKTMYRHHLNFQTIGTGTWQIIVVKIKIIANNTVTNK